MGEQSCPKCVSRDTRPVAYVPAGAFSDPDEVLGRRAKTLIPANTPITDALLLAKGIGDQMASSGIPPGKRLSTVKVEAQSAAGNLIRPGDWVNVLVHVRADAGRGILKTATKTILQNIRVYAVNDMWDISSTSGEKSLTAKNDLAARLARAGRTRLAGRLAGRHLAGDAGARRQGNPDPGRTRPAGVARADRRPATPRRRTRTWPTPCKA